MLQMQEDHVKDGHEVPWLPTPDLLLLQAE
jgi:hypothetical protein